jgi:UDP-3-O-[3-hydroxymyristoyl] glucosamine N-acyltransferase
MAGITLTLSDLAHRLGLVSRGPDVVITGIAPLATAGPEDLSFVEDTRWLAQIRTVAAVLVPPELVEQVAPRPLLVSPTPALDLARAGMLLGYRPMSVYPGIHPDAHVDPSARIGAGVSLGPRVVIGPDVVLGPDTVVHAGAVVHDRCIIGARCIIHSNAVIGADGYGFQWVDGEHRRIPHLGSVRIGDDVEIGSGTTVDRARIGETVIGDGTKIDNLVQIGHNVQIGRHVLIVSQVGIAGSCVIEDGVMLAGQAGIAPHLTVGKGARVAAATGIATDVPAGRTWSGWWGHEHRQNLLEINAVRKLPDFIRKVEAFLRRHESGTSS